MDVYIEQLNAEVVDVNQRIGEVYMALVGMHPDNPGFNAVSTVISNIYTGLHLVLV